MYDYDSLARRWCPEGQVWDPYHERMVPAPGTPVPAPGPALAHDRGGAAEAKGDAHDQP